MVQMWICGCRNLNVVCSHTGRYLQKNYELFLSAVCMVLKPSTISESKTLATTTAVYYWIID
jgi:hypothetical protein